MDARRFTVAAYDGVSRPRTITDPAGKGTTYPYDVLGRVFSVTSPKVIPTFAGVTTQYLYDGLNLIRETTGGNKTDYVLGPSIDEPLAMYQGGAITYLDVDGLGSATATNDPSGSMTSAAIFDAWGTQMNPLATRLHPFTYTGREVGEAGLLAYRARSLDLTRGRFTQEDLLVQLLRQLAVPAGDRASAYAYVDGNPTNRIDPIGFWGVGVSAGGVIEGGSTSVGAGFQASSGAGIFGGNGVNFGGFTDTGGFAGIGTPDHFAAGGTAGVGTGIFLTNAKCPKQLLGPFDTWTLSLPVLSLQFASSNGVRVYTVNFGKSWGFSMSRYPVTTETASGKDCSCPP